MHRCNLVCFSNIAGVSYFVVLQHTIKKETPKVSFLVHPWGVEPQSSEPESGILSIELWVRVSNLLQITGFA